MSNKVIQNTKSHSERSFNMKKTLGIALLFVIGLTFGVAQVHACGAEKSGSATSEMKGKSCGSAVEAKMISSDSKSKKCPSSGMSSSASEMSAHCSPEECAEMAKFCESYDGKCEIRTISVKGMTCESCENTVKASLMKIDGVLKVAKVSHENGVAVVCIDPDKVDNDALTSAVSNKGFEAQMMAAVSTTSNKQCASKSSAKAGGCCSKNKGASKEASLQDSK